MDSRSLRKIRARECIAISLNKQIHIYSVDTSVFYNEDENKIHIGLNKLYILREKLKKRKKKEKDNQEIDKMISKTNKLIKNRKTRLCNKFKKTREYNILNNNIRKLNEESLNNKNVVSVFESTLTRVVGIPENTLSEEIMIVQTYFFDVIEDIIINGFICKGEKYIVFTASAGQIRTKKTVFIKESTWEKYKNTLTCGLSITDINKKGGVNVNKYLAYLALCNSATDLWQDFNIEKSIVVDDFETEVEAKVDLINDETYEIESNKSMKIPITHTDGCGMMLPNVSKNSMMVRLPWVKGLLVPFDFKMFITEANKKDEQLNINHAIIKDIYGKEHDVLKEDIEVIFTKSQFKMWKYYNDWQKYIDKYKKYNCQAGKCNEEEDEIKNAKINYQMIQTLIDMTDDEIIELCKKTQNDIKKIGSDKKTMLKVLGISVNNINKNYYQQALEIYPELLNDKYCKEILKQVKKSIVNDAKSAKVSVNGKYTFLCPDLYAFCECLFLENKNPKGLLKNQEVYCNLYKESPKLDCLRSPHLYREHAIRQNVIDEEKEKWFITKGVYTSCHDVISKVLQFDNDGDKSLVCADKTIVNVAERNMKEILPLYYNMRKAEAKIIDKHVIFNGLKSAYTGGNIGAISNDITKIWNSDNINLDVIKLLCMENNFTIDYAKTLYKPKRPRHIKNLITSYTKAKVPHFFIYAKDKTKDKVESTNNSVVNRLGKLIKNPKITFDAELGKFDYKMLMNNKDIELNESNKEIIKKYTELDLKSHFMINKDNNDDKTRNTLYLYQDIKNQILKINNDANYVSDVIIKYLYEHKNSSYKTTLWECFGDIIVENIKRNIASGFNKKAIQCKKCGKLIEATSNKKKYCNECAKEINIKKTIENRKNKKCLK